MSTKSISHKLSYLLRHGANEEGVPMDAAGWVPIPRVLAWARIDRATLDEVVRSNNKERYQLDGDRIRACQGHSLSGTPVTVDALEASWEVWAGQSSLWHGTTAAALPSILQQGLWPQARTHVHLAPAADAKVGKRANVQVLLRVDPARVRAAGIGIFSSSNGVILARHIPPEAIVVASGRGA